MDIWGTRALFPGIPGGNSALAPHPCVQRSYGKSLNMIPGLQPLASKLIHTSTLKKHSHMGRGGAPWLSAASLEQPGRNAGARLPVNSLSTNLNKE